MVGTTPASYVPYGVLSLQAAAAREGMEVEVLRTSCLDECVFESSDGLGIALADLVDGTGYDVVGLSTICGSFHHSLAIALELKRRYPHLPLWMGGPHASSLASLFLERFPEIQAVFVGEGETSFVSALRAPGALEPDSLSGIPGVCVRGAPFRPTELVEDLDSLPMIHTAPDFLSFVTSAKNLAIEGLPLEAERGCPGRCTFCSTRQHWGNRARYKSGQRLIAEMRWLCAATGLRFFSLNGDDMAAWPQRFRSVCEDLRTVGEGYTWECSLKLSRLQPNDLDLLWAAGCRGIFVGVESGSQETLDRIAKDIDLRKLVDLIYRAIDKGFSIHTSFIVGFPWETKDDLKKTYALHFDLLEHGVARSHVDPACPLPGTDLSRAACEEPIDPGTGISRTVTDQLPLGSGGIQTLRRCPELFTQFGRFETKNVDTSELAAYLMAARMVASHFETQRSAFSPRG